MGEAVAKEPSMEEILSSIRKIITDDGGSDAPAKADASSDKKPDLQIAKSEKVNKPNIAPSAAEIKSALAAIQENVKETVAETKEVEAETKETATEEVEAEAEAETEVAEIKPEIAEPVETEVPEPKAEVISSLASEEPDSISFVDMPSGNTDAANDVAEVEAAPTITAETVSEVPAQSSKSPTQDTEAMASNEAANFKSALMSSNTDKIVNEAFEELRRVTMEDIDDKTESMLRPMLSEWLDNNLPTLVERLVREEIERVSGSR